MNKFAIAFVAASAIIVVQASRAVEQNTLVELTLSSGDCSKGTVEQRLSCLNNEVKLLKRALEGREGRIVPLVR